MANEIPISAQVQPGDIVFNCPKCTKSLAIASSAAGFTITCPDCGTEVQVPASTENLAENLEETVLTLRSRLSMFERRATIDRERLEKITQEMALIQAALDRTNSLLQDALEPMSDESLQSG
jgi:DNA repair exonuclease SbcCD ATPase subunit